MRSVSGGWGLLGRSWFQPLAWRADLLLENLALRRQIAVLQRAQPRPRLRAADRVLWLLLSRTWSRWREACVLVKPATVIGWHRKGFKAFWRWKSRARGGRPATRGELATLIRRMAIDNPLWGAPRLHGELQSLGYRVSQATVSRYLPRKRPSPQQRQAWKAFLANHREHLAAMDFFIVPTATFRQLYGLVILSHGRRDILHLHVTAHPTAEWVRQQLREAFPGRSATKHLIFDRDRIFAATRPFLRSLGIEPKLIAYRSPWQNGVVERFIGTLRRELLDHVIVRDEAHLLRLLKAFRTYYHQDRTHLGLAKDTPGHRPRERPGPGTPKALPRLGGLHHRYTWKDVA